MDHVAWANATMAAAIELELEAEGIVDRGGDLHAASGCYGLADRMRAMARDLRGLAAEHDAMRRELADAVQPNHVVLGGES